MVLNLLRVEEVNPEIMLERSFYQYQNYAAIPEMFKSKLNCVKSVKSIWSFRYRCKFMGVERVRILFFERLSRIFVCRAGISKILAAYQRSLILERICPWDVLNSNCRNMSLVMVWLNFRKRYIKRQLFSQFMNYRWTRSLRFAFSD